MSQAIVEMTPVRTFVLIVGKTYSVWQRQEARSRTGQLLSRKLECISAFESDRPLTINEIEELRTKGELQ